MTFLVKLIKVTEIRDEKARINLQENSTHVSENLWLYEGDEEGLDDGIDFILINEKSIEAYGNLSGSQLKQMVTKYFLQQ